MRGRQIVSPGPPLDAIASMSSAPPSSSPDSATTLHVLSLERTHIVVTRGHVVVAMWRKPMDLASTKIAHAAVRDVAKRHPGEAVYINVIRGGVPPPDDDVRRELVAIVRSGAGVYRCAAILALGNAFVVSLVRSVVAGMVMIVRPTFPMKVFGEVPQAAAWIGNFGGGAAAAGDIESLLEDASTRLDARVAAERASRPPPRI
jgi:hypothetical protein